MRKIAKKEGSDPVSAPLLMIDRREGLHLQDQIRQRIVECVAVGSLAPTQKLPSTRSLARQLKVSRNTVAAAYQQPRRGRPPRGAAAQRHLREQRALRGDPPRRAARGGRADAGRAAGLGATARRLARRSKTSCRCRRTGSSFRFPFVGSQLDRSLLPRRRMARGEQADARRCRRSATGPRTPPTPTTRKLRAGDPQQGAAAPRHPRAARRGARHRRTASRRCT